MAITIFCVDLSHKSTWIVMELNHHVNNHNAGSDRGQVRLLINPPVSPLNVMAFWFGVSNENQASFAGIKERSKEALEEAVMR